MRVMSDFSALLHELRTREVRSLPAEAATILHGGCAGRWYFDWFGEHYQGVVRRHIGVDVNERPPNLGANVEWLQQSLGDLRPVRDGEVDLVFAGQVIEHLWPEEVVGFLLESRRVLRSGGVLVVDSPNRRVTTALGWEHPEHTVEFRVDEIVELLELAGFEDVNVRGLWLCFDRLDNRFLDLDSGAADGLWSTERRMTDARARPEDSFVWWAEAARGGAPDPDRLKRRILEISDDYRCFRFGRLQHTVGSESGVGVDRMATAAPGELGYLVRGPNVPMQPGRWLARFRVAAGSDAVLQRGMLGVVEISVGSDATVIAARELTATTLEPYGRLHEVALPFELERTEPGVEFRLRKTSTASMTALLLVIVEALER
jgi:SAM-dependent methyltransferase